MSIGTSTDPQGTNVPTNSSITIAADGTALVAWFDGSNTVYSYASSPYSSWSTKATLTAGTRFAVSLALDTSDNVWAIAADSTGNPQYYPLTKSGATYSLGSASEVYTNSVSPQIGMPMMTVKDSQGRYWMISNDNAYTGVWTYYSATPATPAWTSSLAGSCLGSMFYPAADIVGNYLVTYFVKSTYVAQFRRADISGGTVGAWSAAANVTHGNSGPSDWGDCCFRGNGAGVGVLVYQKGESDSGIAAQTYTAATNTWSTVTQLSTETNDADPTLVKVGSDMYCFWSEYHAAENYALVYKKWTSATTTWDINPTTLVASGTNIRYPQAGYGNNTIGVIYTVGTASPYTVSIATVSFLTTSTRTITATAALQETLTRTVGSDSALLATSSRTISATAALQVTSTRTVSSDVALQVTSTCTITSDAALQALETIRTITSDVALILTSTVTIPSDASLAFTYERTIPSDVSLLQPIIITIPATVALCTDVSQFRTIEPVTVSLQLNPCHLTDDEDEAYDVFLEQVHMQQQAGWAESDHYKLLCWRNLTDAIALCDDIATDYWRYSIGFISDIPPLLSVLLELDPSTLPATNDIGLAATYKSSDVRVSQESWEYYMYSVTYAVAYPYYCNYDELRAIYKAVTGV